MPFASCHPASALDGKGNPAAKAPQKFHQFLLGQGKSVYRYASFRHICCTHSVLQLPHTSHQCSQTCASPAHSLHTLDNVMCNMQAPTNSRGPPYAVSRCSRAHRHANTRAAMHTCCDTFTRAAIYAHVLPYRYTCCHTYTRAPYMHTCYHTCARTAIHAHVVP
jgi:hypothetical protein